jgi:hypothetical protein
MTNGHDLLLAPSIGAARFHFMVETGSADQKLCQKAGAAKKPKVRVFPVFHTTVETGKVEQKLAHKSGGP